MDKFWKNALKVGGPVTIVAFVLWWVIGKIFEEEIFGLFGGGQSFIIVLIIISGLLICLFAAILTFKNRSSDLPTNLGNKAVFKDSTIQGDVVLGDKNTKANKDD